MSHSTYLNLISGQAPAVLAIPGQAALSVLSLPYSAVVRLRNHLYADGHLKIHKATVPTLSIGNLTTGGTGKTPLVVWVCRTLADRPLRCAILTRGYKTQRGELSDEPALLAGDCPEAAVVVNPDRVAGAAEATDHRGAQVLIMDDGFQHRRLARDLDIVTVDATRPFGYGRLLPAGLLREPITGLRRAQAVVITRCDQVSQDAVERIEEKILGVNPTLVIARSVHAATGLQTADGAESPPNRVRGERVFAFSGLGNPAAFYRTLGQLGAVLVESLSFDDHHDYTLDDLDDIRERARRQRADLILTTQKDWMRLARLPARKKAPPLAYLAIELQFTRGQKELTALIDSVLAGTMSRL